MTRTHRRAKPRLESLDEKVLPAPVPTSGINAVQIIHYVNRQAITFKANATPPAGPSATFNNGPH